MARKKRCRRCGKLLRLNYINFHGHGRTKDGFMHDCVTCVGKANDLRMLKVEDISPELLNKRLHKPIKLNEPCKLRRLFGKSSSNLGGNLLEGKFIAEYDSYFIFEMKSGFKECFRKNDINIDWGIV